MSGFRGFSTSRCNVVSSSEEMDFPFGGIAFIVLIVSFWIILLWAVNHRSLQLPPDREGDGSDLEAKTQLELLRNQKRRFQCQTVAFLIIEIAILAALTAVVYLFHTDEYQKGDQFACTGYGF